MLEGRTPSEAMKGWSGGHMEPCERSPLFSSRIEPRAREYLDHSWIGSTVCGLSGVICQTNGKLFFSRTMGKNLEPEKGSERILKSWKPTEEAT